MSQYPMIPVPKAMDIVLRHTAEVLLESFHPTEDSEAQTQTTSNLRMDRTKTDDTFLPGRISAQDVKLPVPGYPPFPASIMDGYAIHVNDSEASFDTTSDDDPSVPQWTHEIRGSVFAGPYAMERNRAQESEVSFRDNGVELPSAVYVTTGAVIPPEFNAVVPVEDCAVSSSDADSKDGNHPHRNGGFLSVRNNKVVKKWEWIREVGSDIASDTVVLRAGQEIGPAEIGVLSQCGVSEVMVRRKPLVGILSSGNELMSISDVTAPRSAGNHLQGEIFDANRPALLALVNEIGGVGVDLGIASDDHDVLERKLRHGLEECDILITSGGISMGDKDLLEEVFTKRFNAQVHFGRLHMKPGKPTTFFTWKNENGATKLIFALPGNPVSALVCSHLLLRPALTLLCRGTEQTSGNVTDIVQNAIVHTEIDAVLAMDAKLDKVRPEYHRVSLRWEGGTRADGGGGRFIATSTGMQRSSRLLSMNGADGLLCLPKGIPGEKMVCRAGETRPVLIIGGPFGGMQGPTWKDCRHAATITATSKPFIAVGFIGVNVNMEEKDVIGKVERSLQNARVVHQTRISTGVTGGGEEVIQIIRNHHVDLRNIQLVVVAVGGGFQRELDVSSSLRNFLEKRADAMALQARRGAAGDNGLCALFEVVVGWTDNKLVLCLPALGLQGGLTSVSSLLGHAIALASGAHHGGKHIDPK